MSPLPQSDPVAAAGGRHGALAQREDPNVARQRLGRRPLSAAEWAQRAEWAATIRDGGSDEARLAAQRGLAAQDWPVERDGRPSRITREAQKAVLAELRERLGRPDVATKRCPTCEGSGRVPEDGTS